MIPAFTAAGYLPPFLAGFPGAGPVSTTPYPTDPLELATRFATSPERIAILLGLFQYRSKLRGVGVPDAFQLLNGSFCEDIEATAKRPPGDVDVVTFLYRPPAHSADADWDALQVANPDLFEAKLAKAKYRCDAYIVDLTLDAGSVLSQTMYWLNVFSHKRATYEWKGMLSLDLAADDGPAIDHLLHELGVP